MVPVEKGPHSVGTLSDLCRLTDCRSVGLLSGVCRSSVGILCRSVEPGLKSGLPEYKFASAAPRP